MITDEHFSGKYGATFTHKYKREIGIFHEYYQDSKREVRDRCSVDIIIPFHGQYDSVRRLVLSILEFTRSNPYQITLVDDGSPNAEFIQTMQQAPQTKCVRLDKQQGFASALKAGYMATKQPYVCFLHSDCLILNANWLEEMGNALLSLRPKNVRIVSARSDNPMSDIEGLKAEKNTQSEHIIVESPLPLYCSLCHRDLFKYIQGFLKEYPFACFEDEELFWRMKKFGFKQAICGTSWVQHVGEVTIKDVIRHNPEVVSVMNENRERCLNDIKLLFKKK